MKLKDYGQFSAESLCAAIEKLGKLAQREKKTNWIAHSQLQKIKKQMLKAGADYDEITAAFTITDHDLEHTPVGKYAASAYMILKRYFKQLGFHAATQTLVGLKETTYVIHIKQKIMAPKKYQARQLDPRATVISIHEHERHVNRIKTEMYVALASFNRAGNITNESHDYWKKRISEL